MKRKRFGRLPDAAVSYRDEDLPDLLASLLRNEGYQADHVRELGLSGQPDSRIFQAAVENRAVLVTGDSDFGNLVRFPLGSHFGIVVVAYPSAMRTRELATEISAVLCRLEETILRGSLVVIEPSRLRIRRAL